MTQITPQPGIMDIDLYVGGASAVAGVTDVVKLSSNENPLGPSPAAVEAFKAVANALHIYPSSDHASLRKALAEVHGLEAERIICCAGSGDVLNLLCQAYAGPGDEVIHTEHGFALYRIYALAAGATPVEVAERARVTDVDAILAACTPATRLVFIANPNNPTGTMIDAAEMTRLAEGLPERCLLVIDGAYGEFVEGYDSGAALAQSRENVVMTRTFSKLYGLGGLRIGWGYGPRAIIDVLNRIRGPFNLSAAALAAAEVSVRDHAYADQCRAQNAKWRDWMIAQLDHMGVPCDASSANFILPRFETAAQAEGCDAYLQSLGLIVRRVGGYNLPHCLRITVGDETACRRVIEGIRAYLEDL